MNTVEQVLLAEKYAAQSISVLRQLQKLGHFKSPESIQELKKEDAFDGLRGRDDYRELLKNLDR